MPLENFGVVHPLVYRSAQPDPHGFAMIRALAVDVVCKLSRDDEFSNHEELTALAGVNVMMNDTFPVWAPDRAYVERLVDELDLIVHNGHRVLVHCMKGRDRTGLLIGAYEILKLKKPLEEVLALFNDYGTTPFSYIGDIHVRGLLSDLAAGRP